MTQPQGQTRVRETRAVQSNLAPNAKPRRWFRVSLPDNQHTVVIAGGGFQDGVAFCVLDKSKDCEHVQAVTKFGFLDDEPKDDLAPFSEESPSLSLCEVEV